MSQNVNCSLSVFVCVHIVLMTESSVFSRMPQTLIFPKGDNKGLFYLSLKQREVKKA